jgi:hypothetical protein
VSASAKERFVIERVLREADGLRLHVARDTELGRQVAITEVDAGGEEVARSLARVEHPGVLRVFDVVRDGDKTIVAMELLDGKPLDAWLAAAPRHGREIRAAFERAREGLEAARKEGVAHGRLSASDIIVVGDGGAGGRVVVTGFLSGSGHRRERNAARDIEALDALARSALHDNGRRRGARAVLLVAASVTALAAIGITVAMRSSRPAADECTGANSAGWDVLSRASVLASLAPLPADVARGAAARSLSALTAYATRWQAARDIACHQAPKAHRDAALLCLAARATALGDLIRESRTLRLDLRADVDQLVGELPGVESCTTDAADLLVAELGAAAAPRVARLQMELTEIVALVRVGDRDGARGRLAAVEPRVAAQRSSTLQAYLLLARAATLADGAFEDSVHAAQSAAALATKLALDDVAARAWLIASSGSRRADLLDRAAEQLAFAEQAIVRAGDDPQLRARFLVEQMRLQVAQHRFADAAHALPAARALAERFAPAVGAELDTLTIRIESGLGDSEHAVKLAREMLAAARRSLGEAHRRTIALHVALGVALDALGDRHGNLDERRLVVDLVAHAYGAGSAAHVQVLVDYAMALIFAGRPEDALPIARAARQQAHDTEGELSADVAHAYGIEGSALFALEDDDAISPLEHSVSIFRDVYGARNVNTADAELGLAMALGAFGRTADAVTHGREALAIFQATYGDDHPKVARVRCILGGILVDAGDLAAARAELERGLPILQEKSRDLIDLGSAEFSLARALVSDVAQHARAVTLAKSALARFEAVGPAVAGPRVARVREWLVEHRVR